MAEPHLTISLLNESFAICRLEPQAAVPTWAVHPRFSSVTRTPTELSIVCPQSDVPPGIPCEKDWRCFQVQGPLDFALTGILASLSSALARAGISIFAISTYETDYILVKQERLNDATRTLRATGHLIQT